ncbi:hypothetical protein TNCV_2361411 [Trichonephila clavipes]|nr:hypothetical protein TNCV_2361411 [Trichonephila clavipes]
MFLGRPGTIWSTDWYQSVANRGGGGGNSIDKLQSLKGGSSAGLSIGRLWRAPRGPIVRVQYFVRGGSVGHRSRASSKHLSPHLPVGELDSSGGQTGVALHLQMHVWVSGPQRKPTRC